MEVQLEERKIPMEFASLYKGVIPLENIAEEGLSSPPEIVSVPMGLPLKEVLMKVDPPLKAGKPQAKRGKKKLGIKRSKKSFRLVPVVEVMRLPRREVEKWTGDWEGAQLSSLSPLANWREGVVSKLPLPPNSGE